MPYVYLIQNGDLFKIGRTDNLERRLKQLQPCTVIQTLETDRSRDLEHELHKRFKSKRIPQTEYFRLTKSQVEEVAIALGKTRQPGGSSSAPGGSGSNSSESAGSSHTSSDKNSRGKQTGSKTRIQDRRGSVWDDPEYCRKKANEYWEATKEQEGLKSKKARKDDQRNRQQLDHLKGSGRARMPDVGYATPDSIRRWKEDQQKRAKLATRDNSRLDKRLNSWIGWNK